MILSELRRLLAEATPGPWEAHGQAIEIPVGVLLKTAIGGFEERRDIDAIVFLRNHAETLLEAAEWVEKAAEHGPECDLDGVVPSGPPLRPACTCGLDQLRAKLKEPPE